MKTKIIIFFLLLILLYCGYEAIHSKKNSKSYNFSIIKIDLIGDREINLKIKEKLSNHILNQEDKTADLIISTHEANNLVLDKALQSIIKLDGVIKEPVCLSIYS